MISLLPDLRVLDFGKVTSKEREKAKVKFPKETQADFEKKLQSMTIKEKVRLAVQKAQTVEEVNQIEILLKSSKLSEDLLDQSLRRLNM